MISKIKIKKLLLLTVFCLLTGQGLSLFTQKIELENSLRDKIYSELGRVINQSRFVVVFNLDLGLHSDVISDPRSGIDNNSNSIPNNVKYFY